MSAAASSTTVRQLYRNKWGLWLFFLSESFLFAGLLVSRFYLWGNTRPDLDQVLGLTVTSILLLSSFFVNRGEMLMKFGDRKGMMSNFLIAATLGLAFLVGVLGFEWRGHILPTDGAFGAVLYGMTGMHALHVLSGIVFLLIVWNNGRKGHYSPEGYWAVQACALWWHYVDLVWVFFYPALYLMGNVVS
jgi:cytochrome c oxidase subunit 3